MPMSLTARRYRDLTAALKLRRRLAPGGALTQADEARFAASLDRLWQQLTQDEQARIERDLAAPGSDAR
jgi:hypothetical protein